MVCWQILIEIYKTLSDGSKELWVRSPSRKNGLKYYWYDLQLSKEAILGVFGD